MPGRPPVPTCFHNLGRDWIDTGTSALNRMLPPGTLCYIIELPDHVKKAAAYELFAAFFSHYLPKKLIHHYIYGNGLPLKLTQQEMIDCNPYITVLRSRVFLAKLEGMSKMTPSVEAEKLEFTCPAGAFTNGTLGQFTVNMSGTLTFRSMNDWVYVGMMDFHDEWDFDPKDFGTGSRSLQGELKTRFADYTLPGNGFNVTSEAVEFTQDNKDETVRWRGGKPVAAPDRIAQLDFELKKIE